MCLIGRWIGVALIVLAVTVSDRVCSGQVIRGDCRRLEARKSRDCLRF